MDIAQLVRLPTKTRRSWVQPLIFHNVYDNLDCVCSIYRAYYKGTKKQKVKNEEQNNEEHYKTYYKGTKKQKVKNEVQNNEEHYKTYATDSTPRKTILQRNKNAKRKRKKAFLGFVQINRKNK